MTLHTERSYLSVLCRSEERRRGRCFLPTCRSHRWSFPGRWWIWCRTPADAEHVIVKPTCFLRGCSHAGCTFVLQSSYLLTHGFQLSFFPFAVNCSICMLHVQWVFPWCSHTNTTMNYGCCRGKQRPNHYANAASSSVIMKIVWGLFGLCVCVCVCVVCVCVCVAASSAGVWGGRGRGLSVRYLSWSAALVLSPVYFQSVWGRRLITYVFHVPRQTAARGRVEFNFDPQYSLCIHVTVPWGWSSVLANSPPWDTPQVIETSSLCFKEIFVEYLGLCASPSFVMDVQPSFWYNILYIFFFFKSQ